ncbi:MAG: glycosyl transferase, family 39, partial [Ilumatobacteraceae bacterium]|nr:glycosyl transferase, family 39 [Ilumatobacteraceae bacterium]
MYRDGLGHPEDTPTTTLPWRCGLVASIGATMLLADRVATATGSTSGWFGRLLAHGDVGGAVVLVAFTVGVLTPWIADPRDGRSVDRAAIVRWFRRGAVIVYSLWLIAVVAAIAALHPTTSGRQLLSTLVVFRPVGSGTILTGLGIGPLVLEMVLIGAAAPFLGRFLRAPARHIAGREMSGTVVAVLLAGAGLAIRLVVIAAGHRSPTGPLSTLPADLDLVGAGIAIALWVQPSRGDRPTPPRRPALIAGAIAVAGFVVMAVAITQPRVPGTESGGSLFLQSVLGTVVAASITFAVIASATVGRWSRTVGWVALMAPGLLLFHETLFIVFARQYVDRITTDVLGVHLVGAAFPPFLWAFLVAVAIGLALAALVLQPLALALGTRVTANWFTLTSAGVVALGFVWRVIALLTIAPAKVDGGDPLFYHTTANTLAAGRGFPEPLHWIAYGTELKSAVHGPLFPLVLSFFSRMGGTTYFDHRMAAALIGAVVVLGVVLVGNAIAGRTVAVIAGVIASFYPNLWLIDGVLFPEGLMAALVVFTILAAYKWNDRPGWKLAATLGALVGLTALARGEGVLLMVLLVLPLILRNKSLVRRERLKQFGLSCVACLLVLAPWTIRNLGAFQVFVPLSTNSNEVLMYANCNDAYHGKFIGFWVFDCQERIREAKGDPPGDEAQKAAYWRAIGLDYIKDHKGQLPEVILARVGRQWDVFRPWQNAELAPIEGRNENGARVGLFAYYALVAFGINGVRLLRKRRVKLLPLTSQLLSVTITAAAAYGTARFRAPAEPVLCLLAAVGVAPLLIRLRKRSVVRRDEDVPISDASAFVLGGPAVRRRWSWPTFAGVGIVAFVALLPVRGMYHSTGGTMEEGFMLSFPERILKGA